MCDVCGCGDPEILPVEVQESILAGNDRGARHNREHFQEAGVLALNLMGSPGSGKTAVLEATARRLRTHLRLGAMSADLATERDAERLARAGIPACHLDADLVHHGLHKLPWRDLDVLFVENVGNLVCPAVYDLGQAANVVVLSIAEGEDKPLKYPVMFRRADLVLLSKMDLLPHLEVDLSALEDALARVMPVPRVLRVSARTGEGLDAWIAWLLERRAAMRAHPHPHPHPHAHP